MSIKINVLRSKYYSNTRFLLEFHGLWPFQSSVRRWIGHILYYTITYFGMISLILYTILKSPNFEIFGTNLTCIMLISVSQLKYSATFIRASQLKILLSQIQEDWKEITDEEELEILKKNAEESRLMSLFYIIWSIGGCSIIILPVLLDFLKFYFPSMFGSFLFFEQSDHLIFTSFCVFFTTLYMHSMFAGSDTIYLCTVQHVSGLFEIVSHRLENMFESEDINVNIDKMRASIELYNKCIRCCQLLEESFRKSLFIIVTLSPVGIAGLLYKIQITSDIFQTSVYTLLLFGIILQLFYLNWVGQEIIDSSENVFYSAYFSEWYTKPPNIRKLVLIIMSRTIKPQELTAGKMIILSMYSFGTLMRRCTSIFAIIATADRNY